MSLQGKTVALLIEDDYENLEAWYPYLRLREAGAEVKVIGPGTKNSYNSKEKFPMEVDASIHEISADEFDGVIVPGGFAPDHMRMEPKMAEFVRDIHEAGKMTAAVCHGGWMLASAGVVDGRKMTGYTPIKVDVENAGATWVDEAVVVDGNIITSRTPVDLHHFGAALVTYLESAPSGKE